MSGHDPVSSHEFPDPLADAGFSMPDYPSPPCASYAGLSGRNSVQSNVHVTPSQSADFATNASNPPELATATPIQPDGTADSTFSLQFHDGIRPSLLYASTMSANEVTNEAAVIRRHTSLRLGPPSETAQARHDARAVMPQRCDCEDPSTCVNKLNLGQLLAPQPIAAKIIEWLENSSPTRHLVSRLQLPPNKNRFHRMEAGGN